jgi:autotransporter-associated beta strand protein
MNTRKCIVLKPGSFGLKMFLTLLAVGMTLPAFAQMRWSSYDTSGNLVTANVATGGDRTSGSPVTFTIPANTQLSFVTKSFTPFSLAGASSTKVVSFQMSASGGLTGATSGQRIIGWGCYNSAGTAGFTDDVGYFGMLNAANYTEPYYHSAGPANLFSGTKPGQGTTSTGFPVNNTIYTNQLFMKMNSAATGISLGTGGSSLAAAGVAIVGPAVTQYSYINPVTPLVGGVSTFDEFAFMFNNTTASPVTVTLSGISLGNSLTWDASGTNPTAPTDGSGNWSTTNANWSGGLSDSVWSSAYSAVIGANNGAAGIITITNTAGVTVSNITFNAAGSGSYNIIGSPLILTGTPTVTVASGVSATNSAPLGGTGFTKAGNGTFVLLPSLAATNVGATVVNAGTLFLAGTGVNNLNDDLIVNAGAAVQIAASFSIPSSNRFFINGGAVTNVSASNPTLTHNIMAFDNGGFIGSAGAQIGQLCVTNFDFRSGTEAFAKFPATMTANFSVKSTPGTMIVQSRANNSGVQGVSGLKLNAGTFICDYANPAPNNDTTGGAKYINTAQMTLAGGTLFQRFNAIANRTETVGGVLINPGATSVMMTNNSSGNNSYTFAEGAITRNVGGTVDYSSGGSSTGTKAITTTTANVNGILGGYATYSAADWAVGTTIAALASGSYTTSTDPTTWVAANNVSLAGNPSANVPDATSINSLRLNGSSAITLDGTLMLSSGGLLIPPGTGVNSITGGTLKGGSGTDLIIHQYSVLNLTISSTLADNTSASALTKTGPGKLIITGTDNLTGANYLNGGIVEVSDLARLASGPVVMNNGVLRYTGPDVASARGITLNGVGGTIDVAGSATVTQTAPIVGGGGFNSPLTAGLNLGDWGGLTKVGSGKLVLAANNVYNGPTVVSNGVLSVNGTNSLTGTSWLTNYLGGGSVTVYGGTLGGTGMISGPVTVKNGGTISPGNSIGTLTLATNLTLESGSTSLFETTNGAAGDLLVVQGNLTIGANCTIAISVLGAALEPTTNTLITYTGTKSGSFNPTVVVAGGSLNSSVTIDESTPGQIKLVAVPQVMITSQPQDAIVSTNDPVTFNVSATGSATIGYQWYFTTNISNPSAPISGANGSSYFIASADGTNNGLYSVVVSNNYNSVTSRLAVLIVGNVCAQLSGPFDQTVIQGNNATFSGTVVIANPAPTFQWQTNGVDVAGATTASLTLNNVQYGLNGTTVSLIASNAACIVTNNATLTVIVPPVITPQPTNITVNVGDPVSLVSGATGVPTPGLQWYKNNVGLPGQTSGTLTIASAQGSDIGIYKLVATNAAGSATSVTVKLTVNSTTLATTTLAPANGAAAICYDTPLYLTFNGAISIVNSGKIRIFNANNSVTPVDVIDMGSNTVVVSPTILLTNNIQPHSLFSGDSQVINYFPVIISGTTAAVYPHSGVMTSNQTYYVTLDNGIVADGSGAYFTGISDTNAWRFSTKPAGPANPTNMVVAADGSGDFVTVQGAVDSVLPGNSIYTLVNIRNGNYVEIVNTSGKSNITFRGQSRAGTIVGYANNNNLTGTTAGRMAFKVNSSDIKIENLTLTNGTPQGGSQAETLLIYNFGLRCIVNNCDIVSRQDTILVNAAGSQGYFNNCKIVGNFDYVWGVGQGYFNKCVFHTITNTLSGSYNLTAARTGTSAALSFGTPWVNPNGTTYSSNGFSFVSCTLEADPGVTNITLAGSNGTAGGLDSWANCIIDTNAYVGPSTALSNTYVFWQNNNKDISVTYPVALTNIQFIGVTNNDPRLLAATNVPVWFYGWTPQSAPYIIGQPASVTVSQGQSANFIVNALGLPAPSYQWYQNGLPLSGATGTNYSIASAVRTNAGSYTVVVSNASGSVTSVVATLTYAGNVAPVVNPSTYSRPAGYPLVITITGNLSTNWSDADGDPLALTGGISSTNAAAVSYDSSHVYYTNANDVADEIGYTVGDGFGGNTPGIINVLVGPPPTNSIASTVVNGNGSVTLNLVGVPGYTYQVDATADLAPPVVWATISTNIADINGLWQITDLQATNYPDRFYRSVYRP